MIADGRKGDIMGKLLSLLLALAIGAMPALAQPAPAPEPLIAAGRPAQWVFAYKLNSSAPFRSSDNDPGRQCPFGGTLQHRTFGQGYVFASDVDPELRLGPGLLGTGPGDPLGATFGGILNGPYFYIVWNDQFQRRAPAADQPSPWGHSKGMIAWNANGEGVVLQVTTPAWPGSGSARAPAQYGNTLGCLTPPIRNNLAHAQHFFALRLSAQDVEAVLAALANASVYTIIDPAHPQFASIGGPPRIQALARRLGTRSQSRTALDAMLSSGVRLISKPSLLHVPPWQLVSAVLSRAPSEAGPALRTATWWASPQIPSTEEPGDPGCWGYEGHSGPVAIATTGSWNGQSMSLTGSGSSGNHAKIGVSLFGPPWYTIFGDLNQQGALADDPRTTRDECASSQNGRGGMFFVVDNRALHDSVFRLIAGSTAPSAAARRSGSNR